MFKLFCVALVGLVGAGVYDGTRPMTCHEGRDWEISGQHWNEYRYCSTPWHARQTETFVRTII
jgi:hypothetical protein